MHSSQSQHDIIGVVSSHFGIVLNLSIADFSYSKTMCLQVHCRF